jgi:hypothetical protein
MNIIQETRHADKFDIYIFIIAVTGSWWKLFQKRIIRKKNNIYVFINAVTGSWLVT